MERCAHVPSLSCRRRLATIGSSGHRDSSANKRLQQSKAPSEQTEIKTPWKASLSEQRAVTPWQRLFETRSFLQSRASPALTDASRTAVEAPFCACFAPLQISRFRFEQSRDDFDQS